MTTETKHTSDISPAIREKLSQLRTRIRLYVLIEGLALAIAFVGFAFWASFLLDYQAELPPPARQAILGLMIAGLAGVLFWYVGRRVFVSFSDRSLAALLERRFNELGDSLLTTVELQGTKPGMFDLNMLADTQREAVEHVSHVNVSKVFRRRPLIQAVVAGLVLSVSVLAFAKLAPDQFDVYVKRNLLLDETVAWPKRVWLTVVAPEVLKEEKLVKVANGDDLEVVVNAELNRDRFPDAEYPKFMTISYRSAAGGRNVETMDLQGEADESGQNYKYTFRSMLKDTYTFSVYGGDGYLGGLTVQVVDSPSTSNMALRCRYPAYMGRTPATIPVSGAMRIPFGTDVTLTAESKKQLTKVDVRFEQEKGRHVSRTARLDPDGHGFSIDFKMDAPQNIFLTLHDTDGIKSREPERVAIALVEDEVPQLALLTRGIGTAITPQARVPFVGKITDDYGLQKTWFEYVIEGEDSKIKATEQAPLERPEMEMDEAFDVRDLALEPKQKLTLQVKAEDGYPLGPEGEPQVGATERFFFEIVTVDELRAMLELRELNLRQRFEAIIEEVIEARTAVDQATSPTPEKPENEPADGEETAADDAEEQPPQQDGSVVRLLKVQRAWQNSRKNANETAGVGEAFEDIVLELVNNRIETRELVGRLKDDIAYPLRKIAEERFPALEERLDQLQETMKEGNDFEVARTQTLEQYDLLLTDMRDVLAKMLELEDFNEAVALLREIIKRNEEIKKLTEEERKKQLRKLLED